MPMLPASYADVSDYLLVFPVSTGEQTAQINEDLETVSRFIDRECRRTFAKDSVATTRGYRVLSARRTLWIDDMAAVPTVVTVAAVVGVVEVLPLNALTEAPEPRPYRGLRYLNGALFPADSSVQVTAVFGWPEVPNAIKRATIELTGILRSQSPRATNRYEEAGAIIGASAQSRGIIERLLHPYRILA